MGLADDVGAGASVGAAVGVGFGSAVGAVVGAGALPPALLQAHSYRAMIRVSRRIVVFFIGFISFFNIMLIAEFFTSYHIIPANAIEKKHFNKLVTILRFYL